MFIVRSSLKLTLICEHENIFGQFKILLILLYKIMMFRSNAQTHHIFTIHLLSNYGLDAMDAMDAMMCKFV